MHWQISAHVDGGRAEGLACADPGARTPSAWAELFQMTTFKVWLDQVAAEENKFGAIGFEKQVQHGFKNPVAIFVDKQISSLPLQKRQSTQLDRKENKYIVGGKLIPFLDNKLLVC